MFGTTRRVGRRYRMRRRGAAYKYGDSASRVGRGPEAPEARGARNRRGVPRREAPHKSPRRQFWNSLLVQWLGQTRCQLFVLFRRRRLDSGVGLSKKSTLQILSSH